MALDELARDQVKSETIIQTFVIITASVGSLTYPNLPPMAPSLERGEKRRSPLSPPLSVPELSRRFIPKFNRNITFIPIISARLSA
jgi:hypothetical protein